MNIRQDTQAQSTIEFTFAVVVIMFLIYGMVMVFRWAGMDLANRRVMQDTSITNGLTDGGTVQDPSIQLNSDEEYFYPMAAFYHGGTSNGNSSQ